MTLTTDEVLEEFASRERAVIDAIKERDDLGGILSRVIARVRGAVYAGGTILGEEGTIPDALSGDAVALARWNFLISVVKVAALQTKERQTAAEKAEARLERVENGDISIEPPSGASPGSSATGPSFGEVSRRFTREQEDGL